MYKIYQIEYGDTIDIIANKTNTTPDNIKMINGFNSDRDLVVGNLMIVPNNNGNNIFEMYKVKNGDTIYSIARMYSVDPNMILMLNGLNKDDYIYPNQELMIPKNDYITYITKQGDTIDSIINNLNIDANTLSNENRRILVLEDQLIVHKKEGIN